MTSFNTTTPIAIVTGGSRGIGKSIVKQIAARGTDVIFTYQSRKAEADALVVELAANGRRAAALQLIAPGAIASDFNGGVMLRPEMQELVSSFTALGRAGQPDDVGGVVAALLTPDMGWVTGQRIEASGGQNL